MKKYNLVYKITNTLNSKIYIGVHSTNFIDDGYMGSGYLIKEAIKKYGVGVFNREILFNFNTRSEALSMERGLVNEDFLKRSDVYNLALGGGGYVGRKAPAIFSKSKKRRPVKSFLFERAFGKYYKVKLKADFAQTLKKNYNNLKLPENKIRESIFLALIKSLPKAMDDISMMINNKFQHELGLRNLSDLMKYKGIDNCLIIEAEEWVQDIKYL